jgi:hypothetical protein
MEVAGPAAPENDEARLGGVGSTMGLARKDVVWLQRVRIRRGPTRSWSLPRLTSGRLDHHAETWVLSFSRPGGVRYVRLWPCCARSQSG